MVCPECNGKKRFPPCNHIGCYSHVTHPCEGCGRYQGICPTCKGTGEVMNRIKSCETCGRLDECRSSTNPNWECFDFSSWEPKEKEMDKIKEELFEKEWIKGYATDDYKSTFQGWFDLGYKSRDKEIENYKVASKNNSDWFDSLKIDFDKQQTEIESQKAEIESYEQSFAIVAESYKSQQAEIKNLRDALEALLPHIDDAYWPNKIDKAEKALKESE